MAVLDSSLRARLRCAVCKGALEARDEALACGTCGASHPVVRGVPIVIDEKKSLFRVAECVATEGGGADDHRATSGWERLRDRLERLTRKRTGANLAGVQALKRLATRLRAETPAPRVLVLGGASLGVGMRALTDDPAFVLAESDIAFGPRTNVILDAHDIPFEDGTFDAVVAQALFEYVIDPFHVAAEIHRVLRPRGWVYAESPFMQQVHGGPYDFFRFTHLGHRRLFRMFDEEWSGVACGPGMALSWSYRYFLRSFGGGKLYPAAVSLFANLTSSWLAELDHHIPNSPGAYDAASAVAFLGRRAEKPIPDREILASYRGAWKIRRPPRGSRVWSPFARSPRA